MYLHYKVLILAAFLSAVSVVADASSMTSPETMTLAGTGSSMNVMKKVADAFRVRNPGIAVSILPSIGSSGGIRAVTAGKIDIGLSARPLKQKERTPEIIEEAYGRTPFIFAVQDSNPVESLSLAEVEEIYARKRRRWADGKPIRIILRPLSDSYSAFLGGINAGMKRVSKQAHSIPGVFVGITDSDAARQIERTPGSFGTTSASIVAAENLKIKALSIDGASPTLANVAAGKYPYAMTMSVIYRHDNHKSGVKNFIDFLYSNYGRELLSANGHVPLSRTAGK